MSEKPRIVRIDRIKNYYIKSPEHAQTSDVGMHAPGF